VGGGQQSRSFWSKILWRKRKSEKVRCYESTANSCVAQVRGEILAYFQAVAVNRQSSMRNWLLGLVGRILYGPSPRFQIKEWACYRICSLLVSRLSVSASLDSTT
jgi:hypothetical protein